VQKDYKSKSACVLRRVAAQAQRPARACRRLGDGLLPNGLFMGFLRKEQGIKNPKKFYFFIDIFYKCSKILLRL